MVEIRRGRGRPNKYQLTESRKMHFATLSRDGSPTQAATQLAAELACSVPYAYNLVRKWRRQYFPTPSEF